MADPLVCWRPDGKGGWMCYKFESSTPRKRPQVEAVMEVGVYYINKAAHRAADSGFQVAARQLRKQGVPLRIALLQLIGASREPVTRSGTSQKPGAVV